MKIECTKSEWDMIRTLLTATYNDSTVYNFPTAKCEIFDWEDEIMLNIDVTFTAEFVEENE